MHGRTDIAGPGLELARLRQRTGKPLFVAVNTIDSEKNSSDADDYHRLRIRKLFPVSAEHGRGIDDLLHGLLRVISSVPGDEGDGEKSEQSREIKVAIIGHPNVGKSTLL